MDKDDLWRHLRREHNYCHFCDADGVNLFYGTIQELRNHFKAEHYLCEETECCEEGLAVAFRTEIDLKAHKTTQHSKNLSKLQARQTRTLDIDFSYNGNRGRNDEHHRRDGRRNRDTQREFDEIHESQNHQQPIQVQSSIDTNNQEQFPALSLNNHPVMQLTNSIKHVKVSGGTGYGGSGRLSKTEQNFPALGGGNAPSISNQSNNQGKSGKAYKPPSSSSLFKPSGPTPAQAQAAKNNKKSNNNRPKESATPLRNDFPALGPASGPQIFTARPSVKAAPKSKPHQQSAANNQPKAKPTTSAARIQKKMPANLDSDDSDSNYPSFTPVPVGFTVKRATNIKYDSLIDNYTQQPLSMSSKLQTIARNDDTTTSRDDQKKSAPSLSSSDNFPSLNGESSLKTTPNWVTSQPQPQQVTQKSAQVLKPKVKEKIHKTSNKSKPRPIEFSYMPLLKAETRNTALQQTVDSVIHDAELIQEFKNASKLFLDNKYFAKSFYETCQYILGERFDEVFPELLVLLPSIGKQQVR